MGTKAFKALLFVTLVVGSWFAGYKLGRGPSQAMAAVAEPERVVAGDTATPVTAAPGAAAPAASRSPAAAMPRKAVAGSYEAMLEAHGLSKKNLDLAAAFPNSEAGHRLAQMATLLSFGPAGATPEGALVGKQVDWLKDHPDDAFEGIRAGLARVSPDYGQERQYLIQFAAKLEVDEHAKMDFLASQLQSGENDAGTYDSAAALSAMLQNARSPDEVESALRTALQKPQSAQARTLLLSMYSAHEPERGRKLKDELGLSQDE